MSVPYTPAFTALLLRKMPDERLATITPEDFQRHTASHILKRAIAVDLIDAERAMRRNRRTI